MSFLSSPADGEPYYADEAIRAALAENDVILAIRELHRAEVQRLGVGSLISAGHTEPELDARIIEAERAVQEARSRLDAAHCMQQRGEAYRLLDASQGGVARSMRFRLAQNRMVAAIERRVADIPPAQRPAPDSAMPAVVSVGGL